MATTIRRQPQADILDFMPRKSNNAHERQIYRQIHKLFWEGYFQQKWTLIAAYVLRIPAYTLLHAIIPLYIAYSLEAIVQRRFDDVTHLVWIILALSVAHLTMIALAAIAISSNSSIAGKYVQAKIFTNYLNKDFEFYSNNFIGALGANATRLRDASGEYGLIMTFEVPKQVVSVFAGLLIIGWQAPILAIVTLVCMIFLLSFSIAMSRWRMRFRNQLSQLSSNLAGVIGDAIGQAPMVKSFAAEQYEETQLQKPLNAWRRMQHTTWLSSVPADTGRYILMAGTTATLLLITSHLYQGGTISIAIVTLVQLYVLKMIATTSDIASLVTKYETVMGSVYQSVKTMQIEPTITDPQAPQKLPSSPKDLRIGLKDVQFSYSKSAARPAVQDFSLSVAPGEKIGIVGFSGSGKTTLTKLLLRFMDITSGSITLGGVDLRQAKQQDIRRRIAYVPQEPLLFHRSILDNIAYGNPKASKHAVLKAAQMGHVDEFTSELPHGYDTLVGERGIKLSGGQRQRIAIARAILKDAPILVLDEATSALDSHSERLIQDALWDLMKGRTAIVIAHRLSTIQKMDRIVVMDKGKIVQLGTHKQLLKEKQGIYAKLWSHQSGGYIVDPNAATDPLDGKDK